STVVDSASRVVKWKAEIETLKQESLGLQEKYPQLVAKLERFWNPGQRRQADDLVNDGSRRRRGSASLEPFTNAGFEAAQYLDGTDPQFTFIHYRAGQSREMPVLKAGNLASPGEIVPRHFPTVLAKSEPNFQQGSGRLELAERIFSDAAPLAARVIVNRVWA